MRTAARVFAERGYAAATQAELIAAAGLTKGAFYFHFSSKAALALAVLQDQKSRWLAQIGEAVRAEPTAAGQLRALLPAMLRLVAEDPSAWSVTRLSQELAADPQLGPRVGQATREWVSFIADIVRRGQAEGSLRGGLDPEAVSTVLIGAFDGLKSLADVLDPGRWGHRAVPRPRPHPAGPAGGPAVPARVRPRPPARPIRVIKKNTDQVVFNRRLVPWTSPHRLPS